jgi:hypothetical protein
MGDERRQHDCGDDEQEQPEQDGIHQATGLVDNGNALGTEHGNRSGISARIAATPLWRSAVAHSSVARRCDSTSCSS